MNTVVRARITIAATATLCAAAGAQTQHSRDAYIRADAARWTLGSAKAERVLAFANGKLVMRSMKGKTSRRELVAAAVPVFSLAVGVPPEQITSASGDWALSGARAKRLKQGALQLDVSVQRVGLQATKTYVVYPGSSIVREWLTITNSGDAPVRVQDPSFLDASVRPSGPAPDLDFHWMTGGESTPGSWMLRTEQLATGKPRTFDSYEPFPDGRADGVNAKVLLNDRQIWPASGWQHVANATTTAPFDVNADVNAGDKLVFLVNMNRGIGFDTTALDPTIAYADGESHTASQEFSGEQGRAGWRYGYIEGGKLLDLIYYPEHRQWRKKPDSATGTPFVGPGIQHPDVGEDAARVWTAPKAGRVRITGSVCNIGNQVGAGGYGFRMGSGSYAPWAALYDRATRDGVFVSWDYFGHWTSAYTRQSDGSVSVELRVAGHKQTLAPGEALSTPKALVGLYRDDLDSAGNECLDWQYRYLWDYTREKWFPAIRMLGYWMRGTAWMQPGVGFRGGRPDIESTFRKVFRVADLMRYVGADVYHRDWGWWDRAGDWNGPDFRTTINYLGKHGMGQLIYMFLYTVDPQSRVGLAHPDWLVGISRLDMSRPEVVDLIVKQLDGFVERWGDFEWRNDSTPTCPRDGDDTPMLGQDAGFREVLRRFLNAHPKCAFQAVNGGGNEAGIDYARYASTVSFSDGEVGILRNYWASLILPPDKTSDVPDIWNPDAYNKASWRGLLCINFDMTGDTWDPAKLEGLRQLIDIYHYLQAHGVVGRWVRVHRPLVEGDDPTMYFQRMSGDGKRGVIIPKHPCAGAVTIRPKGLLPHERYTVSFQESAVHEDRTGADLMARGIALAGVPAGELIYLNLPLHPGSQLDTTPPTAPVAVRKRAGENMGYPGVELTWKSGADDNWISYYEVFRDGVAIDKVAHGTFYFDHSAGADLAVRYEVRTVDASGNFSEKAAATGRAAKPAVVIDDAQGAGFAYAGAWKHETGLQPAHAGTISHSEEKGATVEVAFRGGTVLLFAKLGPNCGKASVSVDGGALETVDTYSADDIWGVCIWRKALPVAGRHTLRITVLGDRSPRSSGTLVYLDGIRAER